MATDLGVSAMYLSEIENGKKTPLRGDVLPRIAIYLGIDPAMVTETLRLATSGSTDRGAGGGGG
jgi:transcriptional regulator with XRE-family HTH domain